METVTNNNTIAPVNETNTAANTATNNATDAEIEETTALLDEAIAELAEAEAVAQAGNTTNTVDDGTTADEVTTDIADGEAAEESAEAGTAPVNETTDGDTDGDEMMMDEPLININTVEDAVHYEVTIKEYTIKYLQEERSVLISRNNEDGSQDDLAFIHGDPHIRTGGDGVTNLEEQSQDLFHFADDGSMIVKGKDDELGFIINFNNIELEPGVWFVDGVELMAQQGEHAEFAALGIGFDGEQKNGEVETVDVGFDMISRVNADDDIDGIEAMVLHDHNDDGQQDLSIYDESSNNWYTVGERLAWNEYLRAMEDGRTNLIGYTQEFDNANIFSDGQAEFIEQLGLSSSVAHGGAVVPPTGEEGDTTAGDIDGTEATDNGGDENTTVSIFESINQFLEHTSDMLDINGDGILGEDDQLILTRWAEGNLGEEALLEGITTDLSYEEIMAKLDEINDSGIFAGMADALHGLDTQTNLLSTEDIQVLINFISGLRNEDLAQGLDVNNLTLATDPDPTTAPIVEEEVDLEIIEGLEDEANTILNGGELPDDETEIISEEERTELADAAGLSDLDRAQFISEDDPEKASQIADLLALVATLKPNYSNLVNLTNPTPEQQAELNDVLAQLTTAVTSLNNLNYFSVTIS